MRKISRVLIVGNGGRERAFEWRLKADNPRLDVLMVPAGDPQDILAYAKEEEVAFTIVGPEAPLARGIVNIFHAANMPIFGPTKFAARIESSKAFAKELMRNKNVPTPEAVICHTREQALNTIAEQGEGPLVIKADGLCAGKGVYVCANQREAADAVDKLMVNKTMGDAGNCVLVEECVEGQEFSLMVATDGLNAFVLGSAVDYKRLHDGNVGPNTGGMGSYSPVPWLAFSDEVYLLQKTVYPVLEGLRHLGYPYTGVLYVGGIKTVNGFKVLEYNCRFGDPETQVLLPRLPHGEFLDLLIATTTSNGLRDLRVRPHNTAAVTLTLAAGGYPGTPERDKEVTGLNEARRLGALILEASTRHEEGRVFTNGGGRVIYVIGQDAGGRIEVARRKAYAAASRIQFEGMQVRSDIAAPDLAEAELPRPEAGARELV